VSQDAARPRLRDWYGRWDGWFHASVDPRLFAFLRIALGSLFVFDLLLSAPFLELWWTEQGLLPLSYRTLFAPEHGFTVFDWLPLTSRSVWACWTLALVQGALMVVGMGTRFQLAGVLFWASSFDYRNGMMLDGGDKIFRLLVFFLLFSPALEVWSVDGAIRRRRGLLPRAAVDGWALRLMQVQMCVVLWSAGFEKLDGGLWRDGSAMYYIMNLDDFALHGPVPRAFRTSLALSRLFSWSSLAIELGAPILIWFEETRRWALAAIALLHLSIEYMMNIYLFEWIMLLGWTSHTCPSDWRRLLDVVDQLRHRLGGSRASAIGRQTLRSEQECSTNP
jgi:Vitamin K-dependent gamma-carboxylase